MKRVVIVVGAVILLTIPLVIFVYGKWEAIQQSVLKTKFLSRRDTSPQFSAETKTPWVRASGGHVYAATPKRESTIGSTPANYARPPHFALLYNKFTGK